jgi:hypothetical protein
MTPLAPATSGPIVCGVQVIGGVKSAVVSIW